MSPILVVIFLLVAWIGFDGLRDNFVHSELIEFSVDEVEGHGIGDARYITVRHATPQGTYIVDQGEDGSVFELDGSISEGPAPRGLDTLEVDTTGASASAKRHCSDCARFELRFRTRSVTSPRWRTLH